MKLRLRLLGAGVALLGLFCGWQFWARNLSLFAVERVRVTGLHGNAAPVIRSSLEQAAQTMTTTHVDLGRLRAAVASFTIVRDLRVRTHFPHGLDISVIVRPPVAALALDGQRLPVGADGTILRGIGASSQLASVPIRRAPRDGHLADRFGRTALAILNAAPAPLRTLIWRIWPAAGGIRVAMRRGPALLFGDGRRAHAKWAAAARVLADPGARGATYVDLRLPDRPAAMTGDAATTPGSAATASVSGPGPISP